MFDITKAVDAAHKKVGSVEATTSLLRMLQSLTQEIVQWRTMGKSTEVVSAFLDELGFVLGEDYAKYTSTLDDRVVDFRWAPDGKITKLHTMLHTVRAVNPSLFASVPARFSVNELIEFPTVSEAAVESVSSPTPSTVWPKRIEDITRDRLTELHKIVYGIKTGTGTYPWIKIDTLERIRTFNGVPEDFLPWLLDYIAGRGVTPSGDPVVSVAIPDLWVVEAASRLLPPEQFSLSWSAALVKGEDIPQFTMFGPVLSNSEDPVASHITNLRINSPTASRVLMRYLGPSETVPGVNVMQSGIAVQELINEANDGGCNALLGYLSNDPDVLCKIDVDARPVALAVTTSVFNQLFRVRALAAGSNPRFLWSYICGLYKRFFGPRLAVGIEPHARVAFGPSIESWEEYYGSWSPVLETQAMMEHNPAVTFMFFISPYPMRNAVEPSLHAPDIPAISVARSPEEMITTPVDLQQLSSRHMSDADDPGVWYSITHFGGIDNPSPSLSDDERQVALTCFREHYKPGGENARNVIRNSALTFNSRLHSGGNISAGMVLGVARILKTYCEERAASIVPVRHPDTQLHAPNAIVSNVYSYVEDNASYRYRWHNDAEFTEVRDTAASEQLRYDRNRGPIVEKRLVAMYETNVPYATIVSLPSALICRIYESIRDLTFTNLVAGAPDSNGYDGRATSLRWFLRSSSLVHAVRDAYQSSLENFLEVPSLLQNEYLTGTGRQLAAWINVNLQSDNLGRTHVIVSLAGWVAEAALARHRLRLGLPVANVAQATRFRLSSSGQRVFIRHPDAHTSLEADNSDVSKLVKRLIETRKSLCWNSSSDAVTMSVCFGYGPLYARFHRRNDYESVGRSYYVENAASLDMIPASIIHT